MKKNIPLIFICVFFFQFSYSQYPTVVEWDHTFGGYGDDMDPLIIQATDSGYLLAGSSYSEIGGDKTQSSQGDRDYWIVKTNSKGVKQWDKRYGGSSDDYIMSVITTTDGGFLLGGTSTSGVGGDKTQSSRGEDYWIVKVDAFGNKQWDKTYGGDGSDYLYEIRQTKDGGYILGGTSNSAGGDKTPPAWGSYDMWIVKIDSVGNKKWDKSYGSSNNDELISLKIANDGGFILTGGSAGGADGNKTSVNIGQLDGWVVKTDSLGNKQWDRSFGNVDYDQFNSVEVADDGGFILGGSINNGLDSTWEDYWVVKTDTAGTKLWEKTYGGSNYEGFWHLRKTNDKGFILFGYSDSPESGSKTENNLGSEQAWIVKIDSNGNQLWDKTILNNLGDGNDFEIPDAIQTLDGGYAISICTSGQIGGEKTEGSRGGMDFWLVKLTDKYNTISGNVYYDFNSNQVQDSNDIPASYRQITETKTSRRAFTGSDGSYKLSVLDSGSYTDIPQNIIYYNSIPYSHTVYFSSLLQKDSLNDFAFQPNGVYNDLSIEASPLTRFRPGRDAVYEITYRNVGTTTLSGQVFFISDTNFVFVSSDVSPVYSDPDSAAWNFSNLSPFQSRKIKVTVHIKDNVTIGTPFIPQIRIEPIIGDETPWNNIVGWVENPVLATTAVDPNYMLVSKDSLFINQVLAGVYLDYFVYFQNTGNDTAFLVKIFNNMSSLLDMNTFEIVDVSHPMKIEYRDASRLMIFEFDNILLPDSNINEPASHGYIHYRIKPIMPSSSNNTVVNSAAIYFDFNLPVITDTVNTKILNIESVHNFSLLGNDFIIYPNPATNQLTIHTSSFHNEAVTVSIMNVLGQEASPLAPLQRRGEDAVIDISKLSSGMYFLQMKSESGSFTKKFVKE